MINLLKKIHFEDIKALFLYLLLILPALIYKYFLLFQKKEIWILSERFDEAGDNAAALFQRLMELSLGEYRQHEELDQLWQEKLKNKRIYVFYPCFLESKNLQKLINKKNTYEKYSSNQDLFSFDFLQAKSVKHIFMLMAGKYLFSTQVGSALPYAHLFFHLERFNLLKYKTIFLQHGISDKIIDFMQKENSRIDAICIAAKHEKTLFVDAYGYQDHQILQTGFCRYDLLMNRNSQLQKVIQSKPANDVDFILLMPTWRKWLEYDLHHFSKEELQQRFIESEYFSAYRSFLSDKRLHDFLETQNLELRFVLHPNLKVYQSFFQMNQPYITFSDSPISDLLALAKIVITDYSSISFDTAYMGKPLIYYTFDSQAFFSQHYNSGCFDIETQGFGPNVSDLDALFQALESFRSLKNLELYEKRADDFFIHRDKKNTVRLLQKIWQKEGGQV